MKAPKRGSRNTLIVFKYRLDMDVYKIIFIRSIINNDLIFEYGLYESSINDFIAYDIIYIPKLFIDQSGM